MPLTVSPASSKGGTDNDTWTTDSTGNKTYGEFNPNRDYFYYNGYGNLVSSDYKDYSHLLDNYAIEAMSENRCYIDSIDNDEELTALLMNWKRQQRRKNDDLYKFTL